MSIELSINAKKVQFIDSPARAYNLRSRARSQPILRKNSSRPIDNNHNASDSPSDINNSPISENRSTSPPICQVRSVSSRSNYNVKRSTLIHNLSPKTKSSLSRNLSSPFLSYESDDIGLNLNRIRKSHSIMNYQNIVKISGYLIYAIILIICHLVIQRILLTSNLRKSIAIFVDLILSCFDRSMLCKIVCTQPNQLCSVRV